MLLVLPCSPPCFLKEEDIAFKDAFDMMLQTQEQYTNSILLITKIKEIIDFKL